MSVPHEQPGDGALIAIDWGTSALRAWRMAADGTVLDAASGPWGILNLPEGGFPAALVALLADWPDAAGLKLIACGMIGSVNGWHEVPYVDCPADAAALARALGRPHMGGAVPGIVPGLRQFQPLPDVMRGEETQIVGALALHPDLSHAATLILPGTHSKWVTVRHGRITGFHTAMTGELFAVLSQHSILGRPAEGAEPVAEDEARAAFRRGVQAASSSRQGVAPLLFSARSLFLTGGLGAAATRDYLSGLLVGDEIRAFLADRTEMLPTVLVGEDRLCGLYAQAFEMLGAPVPRLVGNTAPAGLYRIAVEAGYLRPTPEEDTTHGDTT
ncbi:2-keto-3-deoxy-galactonokinase [Gluconacetobacter diazotrophicus PA1 5]|uniref:2-dehydro-3-deoxygalactonokinase n=1 Tax=Gluconacetobacter diazotrophicus TaxID=33996 RepID=UPI000173DB8C|nr:2-dehydro-3-deoxygalactonokinase [Gluconacetobacter diazotrophicus]ACI50188.1 2-keto-3-deoxy-galactonokinase [Gluconacetobacter diazotrophicus PA1 5]TWB08056.1 2-dehydro-3-deoxygalactonokinase [Gluconacetobacter diazotrophicus]